MDPDAAEISSLTTVISDAAARIEKTTSHYAKQGKSPTEGTGGKRRRHC